MPPAPNERMADPYSSLTIPLLTILGLTYLTAIIMVMVVVLMH